MKSLELFRGNCAARSALHSRFDLKGLKQEKEGLVHASIALLRV